MWVWSWFAFILWLVMFSNFSYAYRSFVCLWRILYSSPLPIFKFYLFIYLFIYLWLCWVFVSVWGLSLVAASGDHSSSRCAGLSLSWPLPLRSTGSRRAGSAIVAHGLSRSAACGIFPTRAWTCVPCVGRQILNHCATREAPPIFKLGYLVLFVVEVPYIFQILIPYQIYDLQIFSFIP